MVADVFGVGPASWAGWGAASVQGSVSSRFPLTFAERRNKVDLSRKERAVVAGAWEKNGRMTAQIFKKLSLPPRSALMQGTRRWRWPPKSSSALAAVRLQVYIQASIMDVSQQLADYAASK